MIETTDSRGKPGGHPGELALRRVRAGESQGDGHAAIAAHVAGCGACARRLDDLAGEQRAFEERISFDRFAAGVERAARVPAPAVARRPGWFARPASTRSFLTVMSFGTIATAAVLIIGSRPLFESIRQRNEENAARSANRTKGERTAAVTFVVAPADEGPQRTANGTGAEPLAVGERIRIGVQPGAHRFLFAVSVDDKGVVTPLYPEVGTSVALPRSGALQFMPDSIVLTGKGRERMVVLLTDVPMELDAIHHAVDTAFGKAGGVLDRLPNLAVAGEQFHRTFLKP